VGFGAEGRATGSSGRTSESVPEAETGASGGRQPPVPPGRQGADAPPPPLPMVLCLPPTLPTPPKPPGPRCGSMWQLVAGFRGLPGRFAPVVSGQFGPTSGPLAEYRALTTDH